MLEEKSLVIEPLEARQIQPASVDIRLGNTFSVVEDSSAGIILHKKPGEKVKKGEIVATLCSSSRSKLDAAVGVFNEAVKYSRLFVPSRGASVMDVIE